MIRLATREDAEAIAQLWEKLVKYHRNLDADLPDSAPLGAVVYARNVTERIDDTHTRVVVAVEDEQIVGYALGVIVDLVPEMFTQNFSGFLADIFVEDAYRQRGIGRALVEQIKAWFIERDVAYFEWYVAARNQTGREFWNAIGGRDMMVRMRLNLNSE